MPVTINEANGRVIYRCEEWGAQPPHHASAATTPRHVVVHHMDWPNRPLFSLAAPALAQAFSVARRCQAGHFANGWADTGQHFTITREGVVLEGRHGSLAAAQAGHCIRGAHAADPDTGADDNDSWGIECEGTYSTEHMPPQQWEALVDLVSWLCHQTKLPSMAVIGHRDTGCRTACPGDWLYAQLGLLRQAVHTRLAAYAPHQS